jgi:hypothetical protein
MVKLRKTGMLCGGCSKLILSGSVAAAVVVICQQQLLHG